MAGTATIALARPAISAGTKPLLFVPQSNLTSLDPVWTAATVTRNFAMMVYETLYARDINYTPQPFMVEGHVIEDDGKRWTMRLREGLLFHDGTPVLARDCVASLQRWLKRDPAATVFAPRVAAFEATDDRTLVWRLHKPFPTLPAFLVESAAAAGDCAGTAGRHRPLQATDRDRRQRTVPLSARRIRLRRSCRVRAFRSLQASAGACILCRRRPQRDGRSRRMEDHSGCSNVLKRADRRRGGLAGTAAARPDHDAEAPVRREHGVVGYLWHLWAFAAEPHRGADQQSRGAACDGGGDQPEGRDDRNDGRGSVDVAGAGGLFRAQFEKCQ